MIDNTDKLSKIMVFKPNTYYKFVVLLREKDGKTILQSYNKKELIVKQWLVDTQEHLTEMLPDMKTFADMFHGRLYMTTDRKDVAKTMFYMQDRINDYTRQMFFGNRTEVSVKQLNKLLASASSVSETSSGDKRWLFDVDTKQTDVLENIIKQCQDSYLATFETKNGYHVVARRDFDKNRLVLNDLPVECKDNGLVLVYMGG